MGLKLKWQSAVVTFTENGVQVRRSPTNFVRTRQCVASAPSFSARKPRYHPPTAELRGRLVHEETETTSRETEAIGRAWSPVKQRVFTLRLMFRQRIPEHSAQCQCRPQEWAACQRADNETRRCLHSCRLLVSVSSCTSRIKSLK